MIGKQRRLLYVVALLGLPFGSMYAHTTWHPKGDIVDDGFAYDKVGNDREYNGGDIIRDMPIGSGPVTNASFETASDGDTLLWDGRLRGYGPQVPLKIDGNVTIKALNFDGKIKTLSPVTFRPATLPTEDPDDNNTTVLDYSHLQFEVAAGRKLEVFINHDVTFEGFNTGTQNQPVPHDILLSFKGRGQVIFKYADGTALKFLGQLDKSHRVNVLDGNDFEGFSNHGGGTKVFITMDQTKADIDAGIDKIVFERKKYADQSQRVINVVGFNSIITFVSDDPTGLMHEADPSIGGYASVRTDPTNKGSGRMVWFIQGAYELGAQTCDFTPDDPEFREIQYMYPFNDGAVVIAGHKVNNYTQDGIRKTLNYSIPAGGQAILKVSDEKLYRNRSDEDFYNPNLTDRRGLLVVNDVQSVSKRASDPYFDFFNTDVDVLGLESDNDILRKPIELVKQQIQAIKEARQSVNKISAKREGTPTDICGDGSSIGNFWSYSWGIDKTHNKRNVRTGFVIGINGLLDVYHNTFFDYVAGSVNKVDLLAQCDYSCSDIKKKNPAACIIDGLDTTLYSMGLSEFEAGDPLRSDPISAKILLRGYGSALFRCSGSERYCYIFNLFQEQPMSEVEEEASPSDCFQMTFAYDIPDFNWDEALIVADSIFDGCRLDPQSIHLKKCGEGNHVLEGEGKLVVESVSNLTIIDPKTEKVRPYTNEFTDAGVVNMLSIIIDYRGLEIADRPLTLGYSYMQYNSPAFFFNNNACFFHTNIVHSDLTKRQQLIPKTADPAHTGGERFYFANQRFIFDGSDRDRWRWPEIQLYNSTIDLWESLTSAGIRYVVKDLPGVKTDPDGSNKSIIRFFDHGDDRDTLFKCHGRVFMLGSCLNTMCDNSSNWVTESAYVNVFKGNKAPVNLVQHASKVTLSLQNGNQFPSDVDVADYPSQRAIHPIVSAILPCGSANIAIGWQSIEGDASGSGYPYGNSVYYNSAIVEQRSSNPACQFSLDALTLPPACLSIDGTNIAFAAYDGCGGGIKNPICTLNASGPVYVLHGGRITMAGPECDHPEKVPFRTIISTIIANKVWNDYNRAGTRRVIELSGRVDIPQDQLELDENGAVQPICLTNEMFAARSAHTGGFVRVSYFNHQRDCQIDKSSGENLVFNWCNRNGDNTLNDPGVYPTFRSPVDLSGMNNKRSKAPKRATQSITTPIDRKTLYPHLLYIGKGEDIKQIRVAGATVADPFLLAVRQGVVREFVSLHGGCFSPVCHPVGVGDHAILFLEKCGQVGLGQRNWNYHSNDDPWSVLGLGHVQIVPLGNGTVFLNSNLTVADRQALLASTKFAKNNVQRLTFYSEEPNEIRVPAYGELDLSSFGQSAFRQEIAFAGNAKLVLEKGATIRFPSNPVGGVVLYFNDSSQLIFEDSDCCTAYKTAQEADLDKIKIKGIGQIWGNKNGQIQMNGNVGVAVRSDRQTPDTDITISLQRDAQWNVGTSVLSGGSFEVGNIPSNDEITKTVAFTFISNGTGSVWTIDRGGIVGFGAGVIRNCADTLNGNALRSENPVIDINTGLALLDENGFPVFTPDTTNATTVAALTDVTNITLTLQQGAFHHNNIADGSDRHASLMLVGPLSGNYTLNLNSFDNANLRGGGNIVNIPVSGANPFGTIFNVNIWDYAGINADGTQYSILAQSRMILDDDDIASVPYGDAPGATFIMNQNDFFNIVLKQEPISLQDRPRAAVDKTDDDDVLVGYVNRDVIDPFALYLPSVDRIIRDINAAILGGSAVEATGSGVAAARGDGQANPTYFSIIPDSN